MTSASVSRPVFLAAAFLGVLLLGAGEARAQAIAVDSTSSAAGLQVDTLTWSHTVGAGSNRVLYVGVSIRNATTVTSNGISNPRKKDAGMKGRSFTRVLSPIFETLLLSRQNP